MVLANPVFWSIAVLGIIFLPTLVNFSWQLFRKPSDVLFIQHLIFSSRSLKDNLSQHVISVACLPYEAFINVHAVLLTNWRMLISGRNLLQWNPYSSYQSGSKNIFNVYKQMWFAPVLSVAIFLFLAFYSPLVLITAFPFLAAWF